MLTSWPVYVSLSRGGGGGGGGGSFSLRGAVGVSVQRNYWTDALLYETIANQRHQWC